MNLKIGVSDFYSQLAIYYDRIFPANNQQLKFLSEQAGAAPKNILDIACGTGGYALRLNNIGHHVAAIDLDPVMIDKFQDVSINARVMNMLDVEQMGKDYDMLYCIGNSIVHLENERQVIMFLKSCFNMLKNRGKLVLQIVNYDWILDCSITSLPTIVREEDAIVFERYYSLDTLTNKVKFRTVLQVDSERFENEILLLPLRNQQLVKCLNDAGFRSIELFADFSSKAYIEHESNSLVIVATKPDNV